MDKYEFISYVKECIEDCNTEESLKMRCVEMQSIIRKITELEIKYKKDMNFFNE